MNSLGACGAQATTLSSLTDALHCFDTHLGRKQLHQSSSWKAVNSVHDLIQGLITRTGRSLLSDCPVVNPEPAPARGGAAGRPGRAGGGAGPRGARAAVN